MTNILQAIATIINHPIPDLLSYYKSQSNNRINALGDALEYFVKDAFANTIDEPEVSNKLEKYSELFSWSGNQNNPPDLIIRNGDAIEVKKIQTSRLQIPLNSSYPKSKLFLTIHKLPLLVVSVKHGQRRILCMQLEPPVRIRPNKL